MLRIYRSERKKKTIKNKNRGETKTHLRRI